MRGKQGAEHGAPPPPRAAAPTNGVDGAPRPLTGRRSAVRRAAKRGTSACGSSTARRGGRCERRYQCTGAGRHGASDADDRSKHVARPQATVMPGQRARAREADGDGRREGDTTTWEGRWAGVRPVLRPFRGVHQQVLSGYVAIHEFRVNLKRISVRFIAALVGVHSVYR